MHRFFLRVKMQHSARSRRGITQSFWKQKLGEKSLFENRSILDKFYGRIFTKRLFPQFRRQCPEHVLQSRHGQGEGERVQCGQLEPDERSPLRSFCKKFRFRLEFFVHINFECILSSRLSFLKSRQLAFQF